MSRLLILACSQRKKPERELLPALERYDGPAFRVLRKYLSECRGPMPRVAILSAKYGLIRAEKRIPDYDIRLTPASARQLRPRVLNRLRELLRSAPIRTVGLCVGRDYGLALSGLDLQLPDGVAIEFIGGGLGRRLTELRDWLHRGGSALEATDA